MKVMWLSFNPSLFRPGTAGTWIGALEKALTTYHKETVQLAVAFEAAQDDDFKVVRGNTVYYPLRCPGGRHQQVQYSSLRTGLRKWELIKPAVLRAFKDFNPDIIHCFGSDCLYSIIVKEVSIPVVIHIQGFLDIYTSMANKVINYSCIDRFKLFYHSNTLKSVLLKLIRHILSPQSEPDPVQFEREVMRANRYFMGRTTWDKNIVKYYSPHACYFDVPEAIRPLFFQASGCWKYHFSDKLRLLTITSGGVLKGTEIILQTAQILKELVGLDFTWRVAGNKDFITIIEKRLGIMHDHVDVELLGLIDEKQILEELASADFFIHPSIIDNSPNAICEAQLVGTPVIASNVGGVPQLVDDKRTGFLYPYNEPHTLAFLIGNLYRDKELLTQISNWESTTAKIRHDPKRVADIVVQTYEKILEDRITY